MKLKDIHVNKSNPRVIKDAKYEKLKNSLKDFPKMMEFRPIVINDDGMILGGNMRYRALLDLGYKEVPDNWVKKASDLTDDEKRRFIIVDNLSFGEHDWDALANEWDSEELEAWGFDLPEWAKGMDVNNMTDEDVDLDDEFDPIGEKTGKRIVQFIFDSNEHAESYCKSIGCKIKIHNVSWRVDLSSQSI